MPLVRNFQATNVWKAFVLNSIVTTLTIFMAMTIRDHFDIYTDVSNDNTVKRKDSMKSKIAVLLAAFCTSMIVYIFMYFVFGYGRGMLAS